VYKSQLSSAATVVTLGNFPKDAKNMEENSGWRRAVLFLSTLGRSCAVRSNSFFEK